MSKLGIVHQIGQKVVEVRVAQLALFVTLASLLKTLVDQLVVESVALHPFPHRRLGDVSFGDFLTRLGIDQHESFLAVADASFFHSDVHERLGVRGLVPALGFSGRRFG